MTRRVKPYAVVQLRQDNKLGTLFNMVGFQTKLKHGEQVRIFRTIPGLEKAEFARLGGLHRNTFLNSPKLLDRDAAAQGRAAAALRRPDHRLRGLCGIRRDRAARRALRRRRAAGRALCRRRRRRPRTARCSATSPAAMSRRSMPGPRSFQPMNVNFGLFPPLASRRRERPDGKRLRGTEKTVAKKRALARARSPISTAGSPASAQRPQRRQ